MVAWNERTQELLLGECKWTERLIGVNVLDELKAKVELLPGGPWKRVVYALFAKRGFTEALHTRAAQENILLITAADILAQTQPSPE